MGITDITWEEYESFTEVETPDKLYIREHNGHFYTFFELGIASVRRIFEIERTDFEVYIAGKCSGKDLRYKAQNDSWPPTEEERKLTKHTKISSEEISDGREYSLLFSFSR